MRDTSRRATLFIATPIESLY